MTNYGICVRVTEEMVSSEVEMKPCSRTVYKIEKLKKSHRGKETGSEAGEDKRQ
jgi:hypothetical protein